MSKKHFAALAEELREALQSSQNQPEIRSAVERVIRGIAGVCAQFNGNFDRGRFYRACGLDEG